MRADNSVKFNQDGKLVIMQVSDTQDLVHTHLAMLQMLDAAYDKVKPDLVLFTGDNVLGNHLLDARIGTRKVAEGWQEEFDRIRKTLCQIIIPLEDRKIPFGMIYGNHDDMNSVTKDEQAEIFRQYEYCLPMNTDNPDIDCDTYRIPVFSHDGKKLVFNLWMLDSAWYDKEKDKCFAAVKKETVDWYNSEYKAIKKKYKKDVKSLMFLHIPLPQQEELIEKCEKHDEGAVKVGKNEYIRLNPQKAGGVLGEPVSVCEDEFGLFESVKQNGDVLAVVTGHDHSNCFDGTTQGVRMVQTPAASFRCYGSDQRGVRLFILDENNPEEFETYTLNYKELCGNSPYAKFQYIWDADDKIPEKCAMIAGFAAAACAGIAALVKLKKK